MKKIPQEITFIRFDRTGVLIIISIAAIIVVMSFFHISDKHMESKNDFFKCIHSITRKTMHEEGIV